MSSPDLSVIIPTYNRLPLLREALASFVGLLNCSHEVVIVDDGSTDGTAEYLRTLRGPFVVLCQENRGSNVARNVGLENARGRYIKFLDSDDLLNPEQVLRQVKFLDVNSEIDVCYSDWVNWNSTTGGVTLRRKEPVNQNIVDEMLSFRWEICAIHAFLVRSSVAKPVQWDMRVCRYQELDYLYRLAIKGARFAYLPGIAGHYRQHLMPQIRDSGQLEALRGLIRVFDNAQALLEAKGELTEQRRSLIAEQYFKRARQVFLYDRELYRITLKKAFQVSPSYHPPGRRFRLLAKFLGYERAEKVRALLHQRKKSVQRVS